jgi:hypothetical protein
LSACGGGQDVIPDAAPDAADASVAGLIRAFVYDSQTGHDLEAGRKVEFVSPDGTIQTLYTDTHGLAEAICLPNTTVVVQAKGDIGEPVLEVFGGTTPGETIIVGRQPPNTAGTGLPVGDVTFTVPDFSGAARYEIHTSCELASYQTGTSLRVEVTACASMTSAHVVAWATDGNGVPISGPSVMENVDLSQAIGTTVTMPAYAAGPLATTATVASLPAGLETRWELARHYGVDPTRFWFVRSTPSPSATLPVVSQPIGDRMHVNVVLAPPPSPSGDHIEQVIFDSFAAPVDAIEVDGAAMIRPVTNPVYDRAQRRVRWTEGPGRPAVMINSSIRVTTPIRSQKVRLELHMPHDGTASFELPPLPPELEPATGDELTIYLKMQIVEGQSYHDMIQTIDTDLSNTPVLFDPMFVGESWIARFI